MLLHSNHRWLNFCFEARPVFYLHLPSRCILCPSCWMASVDDGSRYVHLFSLTMNDHRSMSIRPVSVILADSLPRLSEEVEEVVSSVLILFGLWL